MNNPTADTLPPFARFSLTRKGLDYLAQQRRECAHKEIVLMSSEYFPETREQPGEWVERWNCTECGEQFDGPAEPESQETEQEDEE
jgi:hypothetical protein